MSQLIHSSSFATGVRPTQRVFAVLEAKISWKDEATGETLSVKGHTENLGESSLLINVDVLPPVGQKVTLLLSDARREIISTLASVIRVERNIAKPKVALSVDGDRDEWKEIAIPAAQAWVTNDIEVNYSDDDWLN